MAATCIITVYTLVFRGGSHLYRGYHLRESEQVSFPCQEKLAGIQDSLASRMQQGNEELTFFSGELPSLPLWDESEMKGLDLNSDTTAADISKDGISIAILVPLRRGFSDIGTWGDHTDSVGCSLLMSEDPVNIANGISSKQAREILFCLKGSPNATTSPIKHDVGLELLSASERTSLIHYLDSVHTETCNEDSDKHDLKLPLSREELERLCSPEAVDRLCQHFEERDFAIKLRRVQAKEEALCINFHCDVSLRTMQVCLNEESEYSGGRVIYASADEGLVCPSRPAGTVIVHDCSIPHGVTAMKGGARYSLFFLKEKLNTN